MKDLINKLAEEGYLWAYLVGMISSDTLMSADDCDRAIDFLERTMEAVPDTDMPDEDKERTVDYCRRGIDICKSDREMFMENSEKQNKE